MRFIENKGWLLKWLWNFVMCCFISIGIINLIGCSILNKHKVLFVGDIYFGETYQERLEEKGQSSILKSYGYSYSFEKVSKILKDVELVVGNLETPVASLFDSPLKQSKKRWLHIGDTVQTPLSLFENNIRVVSLANNHIMDYGSDGLMQTLENLKNKNISFFGAGLRDSTAELPFIYEFERRNVKKHIVVVGGLVYNEEYEKEYNFYATKDSCGVNLWSKKRIVEQINKIRTTDSSAFIVAFPHWFENYVPKSNRQETLARVMIDAGADIVIGHGPHMLQEMELYNGKWIIYSLGNFIFNSQGRYDYPKAIPYSLVALIQFYSKKDHDRMKLKLYPIFSNNLKSNYKPFLVGNRDIGMIKKKLYANDSTLKVDKGVKLLKIKKNKFGSYISINLK